MNTNNVTAINAQTVSPTQQVSDLNNRYDAAVQLGKQSERDKLLVFAGGFVFINSVGGIGSEEFLSLLVYKGIANKVDDFNKAAQLVLGLVIDKITDKVDKKDARNIVGRVAKLYEALTLAVGAKPEMAFWSETRLAQHIELNGGINGTVDTYMPKEETAEKEAGAVDLSPFDDAIADARIKLAVDADISGADPVMGVLQMIEGQLHVVPLPHMPSELLAGLTGYLPALDANMKEDVRFWSSVGLACGLFDRQDSAEPARPDEEQHEGSAKLHSTPIVLARGDHLTVAASRTEACMVVLISAKPTLVGKDIAKMQGGHLNYSETKKLVAAMSAPRDRAMFNGSTFDEETGKLRLSSRDERVRDLEVKWRPMSAFGSSTRSRQWTLTVREEYKAKATATLGSEPGPLPELLTKFARKAGAGKHDVVVSMGKSGLTLAQGPEADPVALDAEVTGTATATVSRADFARAVEFAGQLGDAVVMLSVDPKGIVALQLETAVATVAVFMPTLLEGGARNPALLTQVERPAS